MVLYLDLGSGYIAMSASSNSNLMICIPYLCYIAINILENTS